MTHPYNILKKRIGLIHPRNKLRTSHVLSFYEKFFPLNEFLPFVISIGSNFDKKLGPIVAELEHHVFSKCFPYFWLVVYQPCQSSRESKSSTWLSNNDDTDIALHESSKSQLHEGLISYQTFRRVGLVIIQNCNINILS